MLHHRAIYFWLTLFFFLILKASKVRKIIELLLKIEMLETTSRIFLEKMQRGEYDELNEGVIAGIFGKFKDHPP